MKPLKVAKLPPPKVPITNFAPPPPPAPVGPPPPPPVQDEAPLPPPPPQFNKPVGPPPEETKYPEAGDFDGYRALALRTLTGRPDKGMFWIALAQAEAINRVADNLEMLNDFLGVMGPDPEAPEAPRLSGEITVGLTAVVGNLFREVLTHIPEDVRESLKARIKAEWEARLAEFKT